MHCPAPNYINHHDHDDHDHDNDDIDHHDVDPDDPTHYAGDTADDVAHNSERSCDDDDGSVTSSLPHGGTAGEAQRDSSWHGQEQYVIPAAGTISSGWEREGGWSFSCERSEFPPPVHASANLPECLSWFDAYGVEDGAHLGDVFWW